MQGKKYKPDDTIYCDKCEVPLTYDRELKVWVAGWTSDQYPEVKKCKVRTPFGQEQLYDHQPRGNVSRLLRVARKMERRY